MNGYKTKYTFSYNRKRRLPGKSVILIQKPLIDFNGFIRLERKC